MIQATVDRLAPLAADRFLVVTGAAHLDAVTAQLPEVDPRWLVAEPSPRDSMAAIGWAAALLERHDPDAIMGSFAADHVVTDADAFRACVRLAVEVARDDWLVTIGIEPTHPATGFGYIEVGDPLPGHPGAAAVREFVEKPDAETAASYVASGALPVERRDVRGPAHPCCSTCSRTPTRASPPPCAAWPPAPETLAEVWPTLPRIAIDHAVAEPAAAAGRVAVVPGSFGWDDIGDFASLASVLPGPGRPGRPSSGTRAWCAPSTPPASWSRTAGG